jgi:hypothetical protein
MTLEALRSWVEKLAPEVEAMFIRDGKHAPIMFAHLRGRGVVIALLALETPRERRAVFEAMCRDGAEALIFVSEAWAASAPATSKVDVEALEVWKRDVGSFENLPGREEILALWAVCPAGMVVRDWRIERPDGAPPRLVCRDSSLDEVMGGVLADLPWLTA